MASKLSLLLAELKRRKVYHVGAAYAAVGTTVVVAAHFLLVDVFEVGTLPVKVVLALVMLGFPIALVLAWAYEVKPEEPSPIAIEAKTPSSTAAPVPSQRKSIVVLPFDNMSPDSGDAYFADGLTEEIITNLSHVHSLGVISRTSAMALKGTEKNARTIAKELDVQYVLEGSVRKAGDKLRITAQLIDGESDTHVWADKYDGVLTDVFAMQEQASRSIIDALRVALDPAEEQRLSARPIDDPVVLECYLKAKDYIWQMNDDALDKALELLDRGLDVQPKNAALLASKGMVHCQVLNSMGRSPETYPTLMREAQGWVSEALILDPQSSIAHWAQGSVLLFSGNPAGAITHWMRALELNPNNVEALNWLGFFLLAGGCCPEKAQRLLARAVQLDPLNPLSSEAAPSYIHWFNGDFPAVLDYWKVWSTYESPLIRLYLGYFHAASGEVEEAVGYFDRIVRDNPGHTAAAAGTFLKHALKGERELALGSVSESLEEAARWDDFTPIVMAVGYTLIGEVERALQWVDRAIDMGMTNVAFLGEREPFLRTLQGSPGFGALLEKAGQASEALEEQVEAFRVP